ncbi:hypothetical protein [Halalkalibacterium halodurans]|uniref:Lipoprotein n=1 Tax=Halalkalibacterium halodurans TaxID=86665 RepID=A0A0M0KFT6_ALKHA|nr:hypothetical protein [Halalkalibacterium halodurans]MDY7224184.1 hypothetical protein [Halalkalibacterium halodurans]MDY7243469.1 hypothetical protein [Halalkalibacterium halodurans]TPE67861.1 hypothetical protein AMD02_016565 [Halalkalibacterium halodurans]
MDTKYRSKHVQYFMSLILVALLTLSGCEVEQQEDAMKEALSTDLSDEHIDAIKPGMVLSDAEFIQEHGHFTVHPDNDDVPPDAPNENYQLYWNKQILLWVDKETKEILSISPLEDNNRSATSKGITIGTPIDEVFASYGEDYYTYTDREQDIYEIGYVDHDQNLNMSFYHLHDKVVHIHFSYAFDQHN